MSESKFGSKKSIWPGKSHIWNCTNDEFEMSSLMILFVLSKKRVSLGDILWNTTFWIEDFPLLAHKNITMIIIFNIPPLHLVPSQAHKENPWFLLPRKSSTSIDILIVCTVSKVLWEGAHILILVVLLERLK